MGSADREGSMWDTGARAWSEVQEPQQTAFYEAALGALDLHEGERLLDAGCGAGLALSMARARGADVAGFDASAALLAVAAERVPGADLRQGDLEALPYGDDEFDAVMAFNSVQFTSDPVAALREIRRVTKPRGRVAITTWAPMDENDHAALFRVLGAIVAPPPPGAPGPFALAERGLMENSLADAGYGEIGARDVPTRFVYRDLDEAVHGMLSTGPAAAAIQAAGEDAAEEALSDAFAAFEQGDGTVAVQNLFRVVTATA